MTLYNTDFYAWTQEQSQLLKAHDWDKLDIENLVEEIESLGRQERKELRNRLAILLGHLLKWQFQPQRRGSSWNITLRVQRKEVLQLLQENPSLKPYLSEALADAYLNALELAITETGLDLETFPEQCPYTLEQALDPTFFPP